MKTTDELKEEVLRRCCTGKHIDDELDELLTKAKQEGYDLGHKHGVDLMLDIEEKGKTQGE